MIAKKKNDYKVTTTAKCFDDVATGKNGSEAFTTFMAEDKEYTNEYIVPFHAICEVKVELSQSEYEVDDLTCQNGDEPTPGEARIEGANNTSVNQGMDFDLLAGVKAYDGEGNEIPFTVNPNSIDKCDIGRQTFTYSAEGVTKDRIIEVKQIADPTISGLTALTVEVGEEFDPLDGVTAVDGNGNSVAVTVEQPTPTERLLFTGGAEDVSAFEGGTEIALLTPVFTEPYDGYTTAIFTNLQTKIGDGEWTSHQTYEWNGHVGATSHDDYYVHDTYLDNGAYIQASADNASYVYENGDATRYAKWDSLEIWTRTE